MGIIIYKSNKIIFVIKEKNGILVNCAKGNKVTDEYDVQTGHHALQSGVPGGAPGNSVTLAWGMDCTEARSEQERGQSRASAVTARAEDVFMDLGCDKEMEEQLEGNLSKDAASFF